MTTETPPSNQVIFLPRTSRVAQTLNTSSIPEMTSLGTYEDQSQRSPPHCRIQEIEECRHSWLNAGTFYETHHDRDISSACTQVQLALGAYHVLLTGCSQYVLYLLRLIFPLYIV